MSLVDPEDVLKTKVALLSRDSSLQLSERDWFRIFSDIADFGHFFSGVLLALTHESKSDFFRRVRIFSVPGSPGFSSQERTPPAVGSITPASK